MVDFAELQSLIWHAQHALSEKTRNELLDKLAKAIDEASKDYAREAVDDCIAQVKKDRALNKKIKMIIYLAGNGMNAIREDNQYPKLDIARDRFSRIIEETNSIKQINDEANNV